MYILCTVHVHVMATVPSYLKGPPPVVSYTYTKTIAGKIFNNRKVVEDLDMDAGTAGMDCSCSLITSTNRVDM